LINYTRKIFIANYVENWQLQLFKQRQYYSEGTGNGQQGTEKTHIFNRLFATEITGVLQKNQFPDISAANAVKSFLTANLSQMSKMPAWQETHVILF
jgi:hypothetical protein